VIFLWRVIFAIFNDFSVYIYNNERAREGGEFADKKIPKNPQK